MNDSIRSDVIGYFSYGSNMNPERMKERGVLYLSRESFVLEGYELRFNKISRLNPQAGSANIVPHASKEVEGVLYRITMSGLLNLDRHEGYPDEYDRKKLIIDANGKKKGEIITYMAHPSRVKEGLSPMKEYLRHLLEARDLLSRPYYERLNTLKTLD
jgi:gamma-glutamylcyclotransferase